MTCAYIVTKKYMMAATLGCRRRSVFKMSDIETTDVDMFTIGNNLRELREQKRVTQMQVCLLYTSDAADE